MTAPQAWRIYHHDAMNKTELTSSPSRVKKAREAGLTVVELVEMAQILKALKDAGQILIKTESGYIVQPYFEMMGT